MHPSRGYLTLAAGNPRFLEMAVDMALSLRRHTEHPIALAADESLGVLAQTRYAGVFDVVTLILQRFREGRALKYGTAEASPFEETVFVDADCLVLGSMDDLWPVLESTDMAMTGELLTPAEDRIHHGFSTRALSRRFGLEQYLKTNSGLFCFRRSAALQIMEECRTCYLEEVVPQLRWSTLLGRWLGDELAFGIVGGRRKLGTLPKPDHMYWPEEFASLDPDHPTKPLLHLIWPPERETVEALLRGTTERRLEAGVPGDAETHWREEVRRLARLSRRRRILGRVGWH
jgi:hypothetical protein